MDNIDIKKYHWLSPVFVIQSAVRMYDLYSEEVVTTKGEFKRVLEAMWTAIMLLGMYDNSGVHYFMQSSRDQSPDILTLTLADNTDKPYVEGLYQTVEVVTYEDHSNQDIISFLKNTKLSPKKAYDKKTIILCNINKTTKMPTDVEIHELLKPLNPKPQIVTLGKIGGAKTLYNLCQVWPFAKSHVFDAGKIAPNYPPPPHMVLERKFDKKIQFTKTTKVKAPTLYEVFGIDENKVKKYLKT